MNKKLLSERDICTKFITPALRDAGWDAMLQIREDERVMEECNLHTIADDHGDPEELLARLKEAEKEAEKKAASLRDQLRTILAKALLR